MISLYNRHKLFMLSCVLFPDSPVRCFFFFLSFFFSNKFTKKKKKKKTNYRTDITEAAFSSFFLFFFFLFANYIFPIFFKNCTSLLFVILFYDYVVKVEHIKRVWRLVYDFTVLFIYPYSYSLLLDFLCFFFCFF